MTRLFPPILNKWWRRGDWLRMIQLQLNWSYLTKHRLLQSHIRLIVGCRLRQLLICYVVVFARVIRWIGSLSSNVISNFNLIDISDRFSKYVDSRNKKSPEREKWQLLLNRLLISEIAFTIFFGNNILEPIIVLLF